MRLLEIILQTLITAILMAVGLTYSTPQPMTAKEKLGFLTEAEHFDFTSWTFNAIGIKIEQGALGSPGYFSPDAHKQIVVDYLMTVYKIEELENEISIIYADPSVANPDQVSADVRAELARLVSKQDNLAPLAEATLERQVTTILIENQLDTGSQLLPWVLYHVTPLPQNLVLSGRDKIEQKTSLLLRPDLTIPEMESIEANVDQALQDSSSLIVPVGGVALYPTMVMRTTALDWIVNTIAHEWIHVYLEFRPLGRNYSTTPELRTMNETTASIAGDEIGRIVFERYYPELLGAIAPHAPKLFANDLAFDYNKEMHETRVNADALLAEGKIVEAEAYMEQRRIFFWDNGYQIRKINQAFFAFYGAYADTPGGAAGEDPVGPAVRALRAQSATLTEFLARIAQMDSFEDLLEAVNQAKQETP